MIDVYKLEGRNIFNKSPMTRASRWLVNNLHKVIIVSTMFIIFREVALQIYFILR